MANQKILEQKQLVISEIKDNFSNANSLVIFDYRGLTVHETDELRKKLKESGSLFKVYKNTLTKRAVDELKLDMSDYLAGPSAISFSSDALAPVKILSDYAKKHPALILKVGIVDGKITDKDTLDKLASIPSRETLLTMLASSMIGTVKNLSICLDLYTKDLEK